MGIFAENRKPKINSGWWLMGDKCEESVGPFGIRCLRVGFPLENKKRRGKTQKRQIHFTLFLSLSAFLILLYLQGFGFQTCIGLIVHLPSCPWVHILPFICFLYLLFLFWVLRFSFDLLLLHLKRKLHFKMSWLWLMCEIHFITVSPSQRVYIYSIICVRRLLSLGLVFDMIQHCRLWGLTLMIQGERWWSKLPNFLWYT